MSLETDHINYLIYCYLVESGFEHSSYTFGEESGVANSSYAQTFIPPGSLIAHLQRALYFVQAELNLTKEGLPAPQEDIEQLEPLSLLESVQPDVCEERRKRLWEILANKEAQPSSSSQKQEATENLEIQSVHTLEGHSSIVFLTLWNPARNQLASCSGDGTARIWSTESSEQNVSVCLHPEQGGRTDVLAMAWSPDGLFLATGYIDGFVRIWAAENGDLQTRLSGSDDQPVSVVKFSPTGKHLAAANVGGTVTFWDTTTQRQLYSEKEHDGAVLSLVWIAEDQFVTCGADKNICVVTIAEHPAVRKLSGHHDEVNAINYSFKEKLLASGSDDMTVIVWKVEDDAGQHVFNHESAVMYVTWCTSDDRSHLLASGSKDGALKLFDVHKGVCLHTLSSFNSPCNCIEFSHDGQRVAAGFNNGRLVVWSLKDLSNPIVEKTFEADGSIMYLSWHEENQFIAIGDEIGKVSVLNISPPA